MATDFKHYLIEIGNFKLLNASEEQALGRRIRNGDEDAREELINSNLRLVVYIAKSYKCNFLSLEDLVMEGNLGLITAVEKYNPDLGFRFSTCATPWIKQAILKAITEKSKTVRLPAHIYQLLNKIRDVIDDLACEGIDEPSDALIAQRLGVEEEKIALARAWKQDTVSFDTPLGDDTHDTVLDTVADEGCETPVDYTNRMFDKDKVNAMIAELPQRTRVIMQMRYGLGDWAGQEHTLEEIGDYLGITRERVRQIEAQTLRDWKVKFSR